MQTALASKKERARRARRRENGMAMTAGVSKKPAAERFSGSMALLRAALQVWETKHGFHSGSVWRRRSQCDAE
jgi:hypothetical protein